ncbi:MAG: Asp23/Gls24 family envelope stress response protein [Oscillospiraceae bacterium]
MIKIENHLGVIEIHEHYFSDLIGQTVTSCFGVAGMENSGASQDIRSFLFRTRSYLDQGVCVKADNGELIIDLHIIVSFGVNINAIVSSIINKVQYTVEQATGLTVKKVNVFVDGMKE